MHITQVFPFLTPDHAEYLLRTTLETLPLLVPDTPETRARQVREVLAALVALRAQNASEASMAINIVIMDAHVADMMRMASQPGLDAKVVLGLRRQAASMMRTSLATVRMLRAFGAQAAPVRNRQRRPAAEPAQAQAPTRQPQPDPRLSALMDLEPPTDRSRLH